ncbi:hypothetical protein ABKY54_004157 [Vibrio harveyi]
MQKRGHCIDIFITVKYEELLREKDVIGILKNVTVLENHRLKEDRKLNVAEAIISFYMDNEKESKPSKGKGQTITLLDKAQTKAAINLNYGT